ncbi:carboxyl transferase domain-containing protein [Brevibacterium sp. CS2]|uniref:acetyl-CoA carboxylase family protein n=1 Tax=Brevibacterium sp. CS2 TaxID=2575923 RepID=UPI0010C7DC76|nr:carboxyl transferase domain-containing protein [Brevibacterium sp. CS2]QCP06068.1 ATP-grasp domain-containing protein [Brevibacterium sp. CS2]
MITLLVANRGEIAARIIRTAQDQGLRTLAVHPADDADSLHVRLADSARQLEGIGPRAYLDIAQLIRIAVDEGAELVHPGYGFLAESAAFAHACHEAGLTFLGPSADVLEIAGTKTSTKDRAAALDIPVAEATGVLETAAPALELLERHPAGIAIKALAGGGGRGIAVVTSPEDVEPAIARCAAEAEHGFGDARVFAETWFPAARHIEVQCIGTPDGVYALGDRDCSLQRRRQKLVELAPAPGLSADLRADLHRAAEKLLDSLHYLSLATVEFLVADDDWVLLEVNPRIQVEHTVTEAVTGLDLVACQIALGLGEDLAVHGVAEDMTWEPAGSAIEVRVAAETLAAEGTVHPATGTIERFDLPSGPGIRVDTWVRGGTRVGALYDTVIAKVIAHGPGLEAAERRTAGALAELGCTGLDTNTAFLRAVLERAPLGQAHTTWIDEHMGALVARAAELAAEDGGAGGAGTGSGGAPGGAGASSAEGASGTARTAPAPGPGEELVAAPLSGTIVSLEARPGELGLIEAMKMHHPIPAPAHAEARALVAVGDTVAAGDPVFLVRTSDDPAAQAEAAGDEAHPLVDEVVQRHADVLDEAKPEAVEKIHARQRRTARENLDDLLVPGSFVEYGPLVIAAQMARRSLEDLIARTSGDGLIGGIGLVDTPSGPLEAVVMSYDYMVLAGTQGSRNHAKTDRLIQVAASKWLPVVLFAEGGGGRPGDTDRAPGAHLNVHTFAALAGLKGRVPLVAIVSGRCFAGNAALAGVCDVIIATEDANLGMGGPAMVEGGGLGRYRPEDIGPVGVHTVSGVIDVLVAGDAEAVAATQQYLRYFVPAGDGGAGPGAVSPDTQEGASAADSGAPDPERARAVVPGDRLRAYEMREVIRSVVDADTFLELRPDHAPGAITGFALVAGRPIAIIANDNHHLGGAVDVDAANSFVRLLETAQAHGIPVVSFVDTPGFMVGPEAEHEPGVTAFGRFFTTGAGLSVPFGAVVVRKGYGLGAMAMAAGSFHATRFTVAWPSGEMGPMGLEGAVRLGYSKELAAVEDPAEREALYEKLVAESYEQGRAMTAAMFFDVDDVIDPADTRRWISTLF